MDDNKSNNSAHEAVNAEKVNIEAILLMAKYDDSFKKMLFNDREKALLDSGINFTPGQRMLLTNITDEQLAQNIDEFRIPGVTKKTLPNWAKAAAVILLLSSIMLVNTDVKNAEATDGKATVKVEVRKHSMGIVIDPVPRINSRVDKITVIGSDFTQFTDFTPPMLKVLNDVKLNLKSEVGIDKIIEGFHSTMRDEYKIPDVEKTMTPEVVNLINEIEKKIESGMNANDMIDQYEGIIYPEK